jgi:16S rRNA (cytosine1402-N4)-methyltransferase
MEFRHKSVLLEETIQGLQIKPNGIYLDGTLGGGGHSSRILAQLAGGKLIGIDQDEEALEAAGRRLAEYGNAAVLIRDNYCNAARVVRELGIDGVDGIVLDLGVSSWQLDNAERGFSYKYDTPLDMRMDRRQSLSAKEIVNGYSEAELTRILKEYGEEPFARNIARRIVAARADGPIETTGELNELIKAAIPAKMRANGGHPSKRTFQAIRIECNHELDVLKNSLDDLIGLLNPGGRFCIITFHSLEDRIVKNAFRRHENPCTCPPEFPVCVCGKKPDGKVITKKPILPSAEEAEENSRSKSAKLRIFEKTS